MTDSTSTPPNPNPPGVGVKQAAPEGRKYIALGPNAWGTGVTPSEAMRQCRKNLPWGAEKTRLTVVEADKGATVSSFDGSVQWETGKPPAFRVAVWARPMSEGADSAHK